MARPRPVPAFASAERARTARRSAAGRPRRCPGLRRRHVTEAVAAVRANASRTVPPSGEWRTALPIRLTRIWMTARSSPLARKRFRGFELDRDARAPRPTDSSITTASAGERREIDRALALRRVLAHRANDRQQVAGGGGDVVAVARIVAAQRPVGALDDPLGAFDDPVERRAQHLVERMVERRGPRGSIVGGAALVRAARCRGSRRSRRRRRSRLRRSGSRRALSSARLRARWPVKARRAASALISGISPASSSSSRSTRVSGWPATSAASTPRMLGKVGRQRDDAQLLVGGPFVARPPSLGFGAAAEQRGEPRRRRERARSSLRA